MTNVINPHIALRIKGASDWWSDDEPEQLEISINITKDLEGEPNEAEVTIHNLNADTRSRIIDPGVRDIPIEIHYAAFGQSELTKCYVGEIETARTTREWPGMITRLTCKSQRWQSRDKYVEGQTYEAGTNITQIVKDLTDIIDLPIQQEDLPSDALLMSQTFNGPAFLLLERFLWGYGHYCYITDGVLYIADVYDPPNPTQINITQAMMVSEPLPTERKDAKWIDMKTILDVQPKRKRRRAAKKKQPTWVKQVITSNDYANFEAVDDVVFGIECETLGTPEVNPDNIVTFEGDDNTYRVQSVTHQGDTREGVTTRIQADIYEGDATYGGAF